MRDTLQRNSPQIQHSYRILRLIVSYFLTLPLRSQAQNRFRWYIVGVKRSLFTNYTSSNISKGLTHLPVA